MKWMRYVCCFLAIIAIGLAGYNTATEPEPVPVNPVTPDMEPSAKRFDHLTFTNGSDVPVMNLMIAADDHLGNPFIPDSDHALTVQPGDTVSFVFNHEPDVAVREVRLRATWDEGGTQVAKSCALMVAADWNIISARFWLGTPGVGGNPLSERVLAGDATVCHESGSNWHVIPHETSDP